jgi:hypothetical protein
MTHKDEQEAIDRGVDGAHFFGYSLAHYYGISPHEPGRTVVWDEFVENRDKRGFAREIINADDAPLGVKIMQHGLGSLRGAIGKPEQIADLARRYEAVGVDQIIFVLQAGKNRHEHICESLELLGKKVIPQFADEAERKEREKLERLGPAMEAALARREPAREAPPGYTIDEQAELERARRARGARPRVDVRRLGQEALVRFVHGASDRQLEKRFGNQIAQRAIFGGMARSFEPKFAFGFEGDIGYELRHTTDGDGREPDRWTIRVSDGKATALHEHSPDPKVVVKMPVADFARVVAGEIDAAVPALEGRLDVDGDLSVAVRLGEMFGAPSPY